MSSKPKFLNVYYVNTLVQVRIGKVNKSFAPENHKDPLKAALEWRNAQYRAGVLPHGALVNIVPKDAFAVLDQPKWNRSRCNVRTRKDRKVSHIDAYWSNIATEKKRESYLRKKFEEWRLDHNKIAALYNKANTYNLLQLADKESKTLTPALVDKLKFSPILWNKCIDELDGIKPVTTTITPHKDVNFEKEVFEDAVDLSSVFALELPSLKRTPKVICSEKSLRESLINLTEINKNTRGKLFLPFIIETEKQSSYLTLSVPEAVNGLPLNPCRLTFNLGNFEELNHAIHFLFRMNYVYRGYIQKHQLLTDKPQHKLTWGTPPDSHEEPTFALNTLLDTLLLQLGRKAFNSSAKCLERLQAWHKNDLCDFDQEGEYYSVNVGGWGFACSKTLSSQMQHLCLAIMAAKVEATMEKEVKNRILLKENIGQADIKEIKRRYNNVSTEQLERFKLLQDRIHLNRFKYYPLVDIRALKTPKPNQIFLSRCDHCGSVPNAIFSGSSQLHTAKIECPNGCEQPITQEGLHERELHLAVINWEKRNLKRLNLSTIYMWNLKSHATNNTLGAYLYQVRDFFADNVEYNKLTRTLPREVVKDKAGKGFTRNLEINLLWAELFVEAYDMHRDFLVSKVL